MRKVYLLLSLLLLFSAVLRAQNRTVTGVITDEKGQPFPGVAIQVKGSSATTVSDVNGKYSINVTNAQNVVIGAKYVGYNYQEKTARVGEQNVDFQMATANNDLSEVVVVGYGTQRKVDLTKSVSTVDLKLVEDIPTTSLTDALKGQMAGVNIGGGEQRPGAGTTPVIRNPLA